MEFNFKPSIPYSNNYEDSNLYLNFNSSARNVNQPIPPRKNLLKTTTSKRSHFNDANKVFIGGISHHTTEESLSSYFGQYGNLVDSVIIKDPTTNKSKGFGFIQYSEPFMVDELMRNRPHVLDQRNLEVHRSIPRGQPINIDSRNVNKLFVGGLGQFITENDLRQFFQQFGNVLNVQRPFDKQTQRPKNFAFVTFDDYDPVDRITLESSVLVKGVRLNVARAQVSAERVSKAVSPSSDSSGSGYARFQKKVGRARPAPYQRPNY